MKILYAIQGTGNGHIARAHEVIPHLQKYGKVDILISGTQCDIRLPWKVKYRLHGLSFIFGKKGGIDIKNTLRQIRPLQFLKEIFSIPVTNYDLVLNDFEPVVAWSCLLKNAKCIGISHQCAVLNDLAPQPSKVNMLGKAILKYYAPVSRKQGFHFKPLGSQVSTPVIRKDIRLANKTELGHYTVYLPAYSDEKIIQLLGQIPQIRWQVFSKHNRREVRIGNIHIQSVNKEEFTKSLISSTGVLCNAGFETPAESLFLGKKLCVIPMVGQYEQQCNAAFLSSMGVTTLNSFSKEFDKLRQWVSSMDSVHVNYPDQIENLIDKIILTEVNINRNYTEILTS